MITLTKDTNKVYICEISIYNRKKDINIYAFTKRKYKCFLAELNCLV